MEASTHLAHGNCGLLVLPCCTAGPEQLVLNICSCLPEASPRRWLCGGAQRWRPGAHTGPRLRRQACLCEVIQQVRHRPARHTRTSQHFNSHRSLAQPAQAHLQHRGGRGGGADHQLKLIEAVLVPGLTDRQNATDRFALPATVFCNTQLPRQSPTTPAGRKTTAGHRHLCPPGLCLRIGQCKLNHLRRQTHLSKTASPQERQRLPWHRIKVGKEQQPR